MKNMKKILSVLTLALGILSLTACSSEKEAMADEATYQQKSDQYVQMLVSYDEQTLKENIEQLEDNYEDFEQQVALYPYIGGTGQKFDFTAEAYVSLLKSYYTNMDDLGSYLGVKEYEGGTVKDGETTYSVVYDFTDHDMRLSLVYDKDGIVTTVTADPIYTTGEILAKAGMNTLLGMGVVFAVLILISLIISCFRFIPAIEASFAAKKNGKKTGQEKAEETKAETPVSAPAPSETNELELVAVITAAVAASMGTTSTDGFVVRSIRRRDSNKWKKA
jgi:sodium pump decarboxylase gamma subunit